VLAREIQIERSRRITDDARAVLDGPLDLRVRDATGHGRELIANQKEP